MTQANLFRDGTQYPYARGSHTSWKSAQRVNVSDRATKTRRYLQLLAEHGTLTDPETASLTNWPRSSICSIRFAVEQALLVEKSGEERPSPYQRACAAYRLTEAGRAAHGAADNKARATTRGTT